jgi:hypothetical protein
VGGWVNGVYEPTPEASCGLCGSPILRRKGSRGRLPSLCEACRTAPTVRPWRCLDCGVSGESRTSGPVPTRCRRCKYLVHRDKPYNRALRTPRRQPDTPDEANRTHRDVAALTAAADSIGGSETC